MRLPLIFDIRRSSTKDGPGIRTTVFFKGCNLNCFWCHNPEGKNAEAELAFFDEKCIACGVCGMTCENKDDSCLACGRCAETCPVAARKLYGTYYTPEQLLEVISLDKAYFDVSGGGVTFSGGECMLYPEYITKLSKLCKDMGISVAVDTAGCVPFSHFEQVINYTDLFLYDVKAITPELHKLGTGADNFLILANLDRLLKAEKRIIVRVPVIPNFNEGDELAKIKKFCEERGLEYELLPYHEFGAGKRAALDTFRKIRLGK